MSKIAKNFSFLIPVIAFAVFVVFMAGCTGQEKAQEERNKALSRRNIEEVLSQGKFDVIDDIFVADFVKHLPPDHDIHGIEDVIQFATMYRTAFPDLQITIEDQFAEGDKVVNRFKWTGTHEGEFMGIPPTGVQVTVAVIAIERFVGGRMVEAWVNGDTFGMLQQLGVIPPLGQGE